MSKSRRRRSVPHNHGLSPGTLVIPAGAAPTRLRLTRYGVATHEVTDGVSVADLDTGLVGSGVRWLEVAGYADEALFVRLADVHRIPRLVLEDVLSGAQRAKVESYEEGLFVVLNVPRADPQLEIEQLSLFMSGSTLVTFVERDRDRFDALHKRLELPTSLLRQSGVDYLLYRIADFLVDSFFPLVDAHSTRLEQLERDALEYAAADKLRMLYAVIEEVRILRRTCLPLRDALASLRRVESSTFHASTQPYLRDVEDHASSLVDVCDYHREFAIDIRELIHGSLNLRMNKVMRVLAAVSAIFIPLSFITGLYGMNFVAMPELSWRYGYAYVLAVLAAVAFTAWRLFRRHGWIRFDQE